jgi:hypothetical protein
MCVSPSCILSASLTRLTSVDNDSIVTDIDPKEEIFRETSESSSSPFVPSSALIDERVYLAGDQNPYFLVYCRTNRL